VLDAVDAERLGVPTLTIIEEKFARAARLHSRVHGLPDLPLIIEPTPGTPDFDPVAFAELHVEAIRAAFLQPLLK
jgi:hypothetical protein